MSLCIVTLNVNGIADKKRNAVSCWCRKKKIDIACLQETHCSIDTELKWKNEWGLKVCGIMVQVIHEVLLSSFKKKLIAKLQKRGEIILVGKSPVW